jgi:hypothetical protein
MKRYVPLKCFDTVSQFLRYTLSLIRIRLREDGLHCLLVFAHIVNRGVVLDLVLSSADEMQYGRKLCSQTCMLFRTSEAVATPAFGPQMGSPSSTFSATFKSVRKMAMPFVTSDRVMP